MSVQIPWPGPRALRRFCASEGGALLPLSLLFLVAMVMLGALAVNVVRVETTRTMNQSILDACVLNTASQRQVLDPRTAFDDCLAKHGFDATITRFNAGMQDMQRIISATAQEPVLPFFLPGLNAGRKYDVVVRAAAIDQLRNIEISLVLDISASMMENQGLRMNAMRPAAREFVSTMLANDTSGRVKITLVPYHNQVNLGPALAAKFNLTGLPANFALGPSVAEMRCADLPASSFDALGVSRSLPMRAYPFIDTETSTRTLDITVPPTDPTWAVPNNDLVLCTNTVANHLRPPDFTDSGQQTTVDTWQERRDVLNARITSLRGQGNTQIHVGLRWGLAFLDPAARSIFNEFIAVGRMPESTRNHPLDYNDPTSLKIVVLMSDGANRFERRLRPQFESGPSILWRGNDGNYSSFHATRTQAAKYWVPHLRTWQTMPWQNATNTGQPARNLDWAEVWRVLKMNYVLWQHHVRTISPSTNAQRVAALVAMQDVYSTVVEAPAMDTQLQALCNLARANNVLVYTIAFEAEENGRNQLAACATSQSRHYDATTTTISQVFASIAGSVSKLKLTQ